MSYFSIDELKTDLMNSIRTYVYPYQTITTNSISLSDNNGTITQTCYIYSETISTIGVYVSSITGTPSACTLSFYNGATKFTGTIAGTVGWNYVRVNYGTLSASRESSITLTNGNLGANDYIFGCASINNYFLGNAGTVNLAFTINTHYDFVFKVFPAQQIDSSRIPVIVVDLDGRPKVEDKYLSGDQMWMWISAKVEVYGISAREVDKILTAIDRGFLRSGRSFGTNMYITPANFNEMQYIKSQLFTRMGQWRIRKLVPRE